MARILSLTDASGISDNDYVLVDSPTLGSRRIKAKYFQGGSGENVVIVTQSEYDALSQEEKENGSAYLIEAVANNIDMGDATVNKQSGMNVVGSIGGVYMEHLGGTLIGASINKSINFTNIESIRYDLNISSFYGTTAGTYATNERFALSISAGLSAVSYDLYPTSPQIINFYEKTGSYKNQHLDVSNLAGNYYFNILGSGVTCNISNLKAYTNDGKIMYLDNEYLSL